MSGGFVYSPDGLEEALTSAESVLHGARGGRIGGRADRWPPESTFLSMLPQSCPAASTRYEQLVHDIKTRIANDRDADRSARMAKTLVFHVKNFVYRVKRHIEKVEDIRNDPQRLAQRRNELADRLWHFEEDEMKEASRMHDPETRNKDVKKLLAMRAKIEQYEEDIQDAQRYVATHANQINHTAACLEQYEPVVSRLQEELNGFEARVRSLRRREESETETQRAHFRKAQSRLQEQLTQRDRQASVARNMLRHYEHLTRAADADRHEAQAEATARDALAQLEQMNRPIPVDSDSDAEDRPTKHRRL